MNVHFKILNIWFCVMIISFLTIYETYGHCSPQRDDYTLSLADFSVTVSRNGGKIISLTRYVNPFIGTTGFGNVFLAANVPFGFVQVGPTEVSRPPRGGEWCSGYNYSDSILIGFGHLHLSGTGVGDLGDISLLAVLDGQQRKVLFSHDDEEARSG